MEAIGKELSTPDLARIQIASYVAFLLTSLHGTFAGTDATNSMYVVTSVITTVMLMLAVIYRVTHRRSRSRPPSGDDDRRVRDIATSAVQ